MNQAYLNRNIIIFWFVVLLLGFFLLVANPFSFFFLNDDFIHIPSAASGDFLQGSFYRPLSNFSIWLDFRLWGHNPVGYHLSNILIHLINTLLVFFVGRKIFSLDADPRTGGLKSILSALLFLIYAYHSEPIFWIIGRGGSLATLFFLLAFLCYLESWSGVQRYYLLSLTIFFAGLFVYEVIWCYPVLVAIFSVKFSNQRNRLLKIAGVIVVFTSFLLLRVLVTGSFSGSYELGALKDFQAATLFYNFNTLLARTFLPPMKNGVLFLILYLLLLLGVFAAVIKFKGNNKLLLVLFSCVGVSVLPAVSLGIDTHDSESERFIYLATVFSVFFIVEFFFRFKTYVVATAFTLLVIFHSYEFVKRADSYSFSGMVAKKSLECLPVIARDTIIAINVPTQYEGGLIFRTGFPEALQWFKGLDKSNVYILSEKEISNKFPRLLCQPVKGSLGLPAALFAGLDSTVLHRGVNKIFLKWEGDSLLFSREFL